MDKEKLNGILGELEDVDADLTSLYYGIGKVADGELVELFIRVRDAREDIQDALDIAERILENMEDNNEL